MGEKKTGLKEELKDFTKLQQRLLDEKRQKENVKVLAKQAPKDVAELV